MSQLSSGFMVDFYDLVSPETRAAMVPGHDQANHLNPAAEEAQQNSTLASRSNGKALLNQPHLLRLSR